MVYDDSLRTSGKVFIWKNTSGNVNNGTVYAGSNGEWWMQFDESYVDVKWFGCKGDNATDDTTNFQNALNFIAAQIAIGKSNNINLYISRGCYLIHPPVSPLPTDVLFLDLSGAKNTTVYGDGPNVSVINYVPNGNTLGHNIFHILGTPDIVMEIRDFSIIAPEVPAEKYGKGLVLESTTISSLKNIRTFWLDTGIELIDVLTCYFNNVYAHWGIVGLNAKVGPQGMVPNLLNFTTCAFGANNSCGVKLNDVYGMHSVNFQSCSFEGNGSDNTPALTGIAAIDCKFVGVNGANGLNVKDCYFEGNIGLADIRVQVQTGGANNPYYGTHTFTGNTFNRNEDHDINTFYPIYTNHNILITGAGQNPQQLFGRSKCRLVFEGNGFFVNRPGDPNNYVPDAIRKAIQIDYYSSEYWEFDILEQGNVYAGAAYGDTPVFDPNSPQVSEYTRVKAFGKIEYFDETLDPPRTSRYHS